jgi:hypothetical protein
MSEQKSYRVQISGPGFDMTTVREQSVGLVSSICDAIRSTAPYLQQSDMSRLCARLIEEIAEREYLWGNIPPLRDDLHDIRRFEQNLEAAAQEVSLAWRRYDEKMAGSSYRL